MTVLRTILDNSVAFSLLFAAVWLVKAALRKHLSARLHYMIWAVVIVSLLLPVRIESGFSLWNLLPRQTAESIIQQTQGLQPIREIVIGSNAASDDGTALGNQPETAINAPAHPPKVLGHNNPTQNNIKNPVARVELSTALPAVWLAGMVAALLWTFLGGRRLRRHINRCGSSELPPWLAACAVECQKTFHMRRTVRMIVQPVLPMPAVMGIFQPILALPEPVVREGNVERACHILMHEFSHVRRGDLIVVALLNLLNAVYWFNPLVWLCVSLVRADMETYCDTDVVNILGKNRRQDYIRTLVHFSGMGRRAHAALSLNDGGSKMKKRIGAMFMIQKTKPAIAVPVILLVLVLMLAASATGCLPVASVGAGLSPSATAPAASATLTNGTDPIATNSPSVTTSSGTNATPAVTTATPEKTAGTPALEASEWEAKYKPVLDQYREFAKRFAQSGDTVADLSDMDDPWGLIAPDMRYSSRKLGYGFRDLDGNGTPELFLLTSDGSVWAMYTIADGAPKLLGTFWARNSCVLDKSDAVYTDWSSGAMDSGMDVYQISKDGRTLMLIERVAMESSDETGKPLDEPRFYKCTGSEANKKIISEAEANAETSKFPKSNDNSGLEFIPLD